jgi:ribosomal protein S13
MTETKTLGYSDADLVERAILNAGRNRPERERIWAVCDAFGLGRTRAEILCRRFGVDPEDTVGSYDDGKVVQDEE